MGRVEVGPELTEGNVVPNYQVVFPALLPLTYIPTLLTRVKQLFLSLFQPYLQSLVETLSDGNVILTDASETVFRVLRRKIAEEKWDKIFERCLKSCEQRDGVCSHPP